MTVSSQLLNCETLMNDSATSIAVPPAPHDRRKAENTTVMSSLGIMWRAGIHPLCITREYDTRFLQQRNVGTVGMVRRLHPRQVSRPVPDPHINRRQSKGIDQ